MVDAAGGIRVDGPIRLFIRVEEGGRGQDGEVCSRRRRRLSL
jgi:hypothetical protein